MSEKLRTLCGRIVLAGAVLAGCVGPAAQVPSNYCALPAGSAGLWPGDGSPADVSGAGHDAVANGGVSYGPGVHGASAFVLDGTTGYLTVPAGSDNDLYPGAGSFSFGAWVKSSVVQAGAKDIIDKVECGGACPPGGGSAYALFLTNGVVRGWLRDSGGASSYANGTRIVADGQFHHVALVRDMASNELRLYVDGTREAVASLVGGAIGPLHDDDGEPDPFTIGAGQFALRPDFTEFFEGSIAEVAYYTRALTDADALAMAAPVCPAPGNQAPLAMNDTATTLFETAADIAVLANDSDADADTFWVTGVTQGANGMVSINIDGTVRYVPAVAYSGIDAFTYTINDGHGGTATATVTVTVRLNACVAPPADGLFALWRGDGSTLDAVGNRHGVPLGGVTYGPSRRASASAFVFDGWSGAVDVTAANDNDLYPGAGPFSLSAWIKSSVSLGTQMIVSRYECGGVTCGGDTYYSLYLNNGAAAAYLRDFNGGVTTLAGARVIADSQFHHVAVVRDTAANEVRLYVDGTRDATVSMTGGAVGAIRDGDGAPDPFVIGAIRPYGSNTVHSYFFEGSIGEVAYYRRALTDGDAEILSGLACSGPLNHPPVANPDTAATLKNTATDITVLHNDIDYDGDALTVTSVTQGTHGATISVAADNSVNYLPAVGFAGADSFTYTIADGNGGTATATVAMTVQAPFHFEVTDLGEPLGEVIEHGERG